MAAVKNVLVVADSLQLTWKTEETAEERGLTDSSNGSEQQLIGYVSTGQRCYYCGYITDNDLGFPLGCYFVFGEMCPQFAQHFKEF